MSFICFSKDAVKQSEEYAVAPKTRKVFAILFENNLVLKKETWSLSLPMARDVAAAPQTPNWGGPRPTLGAQVSLKLLFGYVTIFSSADLFTTDLNCRKKLACDIISECNVILSRTI